MVTRREKGRAKREESNQIKYQILKWKVILKSRPPTIQN